MLLFQALSILFIYTMYINYCCLILDDFVQGLNEFDAATNRLCPVLAGGLLHGVCYSTQYGLMTVIQVCYSSKHIYSYTVFNYNFYFLR